MKRIARDMHEDSIALASSRSRVRAAQKYLFRLLELKRGQARMSALDGLLSALIRVCPRPITTTVNSYAPLRLAPIANGRQLCYTSAARPGSSVD